MVGRGSSPMPGDHKLHCLLGASRSWEFGYREELERIAAEAPWFKFMRVDDLVRKYTDHWGLRPETTTAYLCGHPTMCENGLGLLTRTGWQKRSMFEELYFIPGKEVAAE